MYCILIDAHLSDVITVKIGELWRLHEVCYTAKQCKMIRNLSEKGFSSHRCSGESCYKLQYSTQCLFQGFLQLQSFGGTPLVNGYDCGPNWEKYQTSSFHITLT